MLVFDATTLAAYRAASTPQGKAQAVSDQLGSGTLTVELRDGATLMYSGTFAGPLVAGSDGSLSRDVVPTGLALVAGTASAATWTCRIRNAAGTRTMDGPIGPGSGHFTLAAPLVVGQGCRLNISISAAQPPSDLYGLQWPSNNYETNALTLAYILNPQTDGMPIWGPSGNGATYIWEYKPVQQAGYYAVLWWAGLAQANDTNFFSNYIAQCYWGAHPYPYPSGHDQVNHKWEIAAYASDIINTLPEGVGASVDVVKDVWYTQGFRCWKAANGTKVMRYYIDLPSLADNRIIQFTAVASYGETLPHATYAPPAIMMGDAPWARSKECASGTTRRLKFFNALLSESDMLTEAGDMSALKTSAGTSSIWYGKKNYASSDDLTCDYGTARAMVWFDSHKAPRVLT
jgi:hypothetical protein